MPPARSFIPTAHSHGGRMISAALLCHVVLPVRGAADLRLLWMRSDRWRRESVTGRVDGSTNPPLSSAPSRTLQSAGLGRTIETARAASDALRTHGTSLAA